MVKLPRSFYTRRTITVAKALLGKTLIRRSGKMILAATIVETEAYLKNDPASHAFRGITERTRVMFKQGGFLYVYFTYGMHYCANVVSNREGIGEAVLIRAVEPLHGIESMMKRRTKNKKGAHRNNELLLKNLTNGPAKLAQAFSFTTKDSGIDLTGDEIFIAHAPTISRSKIMRSKRIGISKAKNKLLRFYLKDNPWVSK